MMPQCITSTSSRGGSGHPGIATPSSITTVDDEKGWSMMKGSAFDDR
jgi:hypothetical protein